MTDSEYFFKALENVGYTPMQYSGRHMYGEYCIGIVTDDSPLLIGYFLCKEESACINLHELLQETVTDKFGLSTVYYWPSMEWIKN